MLGCNLDLETMKVLQASKKTSELFEKEKIKIVKEQVFNAVLYNLRETELAYKVKTILQGNHTSHQLEMCLKKKVLPLLLRFYEKQIIESPETNKFQKKAMFFEYQERIKGFINANLRILNISKAECDAVNNFIDSQLDSITIAAEQHLDIVLSTKHPTFIVGDDGHVKINKEAFDWSKCIKCYKFAKKRKLKVRAHSIVWHEALTPKMKEEIKDLPPHLRKEAMHELMKEYMKQQVQVAQENNVDLYAVDVLNDIAAEGTKAKKEKDYVRNDFFKEVLGDNYYCDVLKMAKQIFPPQTKLVYNERDVYNPEHRIRMLKILQDICEEEKRCGFQLLDAIGLQSHLIMKENRTKNTSFEHVLGGFVDNYSHVDNDNAFAKDIMITDLNCVVPNILMENGVEKKLTPTLRKNLASEQQINLLQTAEKMNIPYISIFSPSDSFNLLSADCATPINKLGEFNPLMPVLTQVGHFYEYNLMQQQALTFKPSSEAFGIKPIRK